MIPGIKKNIFLPNAFVLSLMAHGIGIYFLMNWTAGNELPAPESKPVQITKIIYESQTKPKMENEWVPSVRPVEKILTEFKKQQPALVSPRKETVQAQPIVATSMALGKIRSVSYSFNKPKSINSFELQTTQPANLEGGMTGNKIREHQSFARNIQNVESVTIKPSSLPNNYQAEKLKDKHPAVQPVRLFERFSQPEKSAQRIMTANMSAKFNTVSVSKVRVRKFSDKSHSFAEIGSSIQEVGQKIRAVKSNQIHPVQLASLPADNIEESRNLDETFEPTESQPEVAVYPSEEELGLLKKEFSISIWQKIAEAKYYPRVAQKQRLEGKPVIEFQVGRNGDLLGYSIAVASPYEILDQAAIEAVKKASPYPKIPKSLKLNTLRFKLPIAFKLD
jgi:TonB family protein